jgi:hypothetical protein
VWAMWPWLRSALFCWDGFGVAHRDGGAILTRVGGGVESDRATRMCLLMNNETDDGLILGLG